MDKLYRDKDGTWYRMAWKIPVKGELLLLPESLSIANPGWTVREWVCEPISTLPDLVPSRRERIATAAMAGALANSERDTDNTGFASDAVDVADALIAALDAKPKKGK